ncbi:MAG TPA: hypothetical protein VMU92_08500 [Acidobacteriaceae bacterium]|nr:hypothetical protein [Acidobacteriaceae bacterium]
MRRLLLILVVVVMCAGIPAIGQIVPGYQKGTIHPEGKHTYKLSGHGLQVWFDGCVDFKTAQAVEYRMTEEKVYLRDGDGNAYACSIARMDISSSAAAPANGTGTNDLVRKVYKTGEILGYKVRRELDVSGVGHSVLSGTTYTKVYELRGPKLMYWMDSCGSFRTHEFLPGQTVHFRVDIDNNLLYVRHDKDDEYTCRLDGMHLLGIGGIPAPRGGPSRE